MMDEQKEKKGPKEFSFEQLRDRQVEVRADGIMYRGTLVGADDEWLYLKGKMRWLILPLEKVTDVRLEGEKGQLDGKKDIDAAFYDENAENDG